MRFVSWPADKLADARMSSPALRAGAIVAACALPSGGELDAHSSGGIPPGGAVEGGLGGRAAGGVHPALVDWLRFCRQYQRMPAGVAATTAAELAAEGTEGPAQGAASACLADPGAASHSWCPAQGSPDASPAVHRALLDALAALARETGPHAPLVMLALSTGTVPAILFLTELQRKIAALAGGAGREGDAASVGGVAAMESGPSGTGVRPDLEHGRTDSGRGRTELELGETDLEQGKTLCTFVTAGCPLPLYLSQLQPPMPSLPPAPPPVQPQPPLPTTSQAPDAGATTPLPTATAAADRLPAAPTPWLHPPQVPFPGLVSSCPDLARCPTEALGWFNYYHPSDPLGYPLAPLFDLGPPAVPPRQGVRPTLSRSESAPPAVPGAVAEAPLPRDSAAAASESFVAFPTQGLPAARASNRVLDTPVRFHTWTSSIAPSQASRLPDPSHYLLRPGARDVLSPLAHALVLIWLSCNPAVASTLDTAPLAVHREHRSRMRARVGKQMSKRGAAVSAAASRTTQALSSAARDYAAGRRSGSEKAVASTGGGDGRRCVGDGRDTAVSHRDAAVGGAQVPRRSASWSGDADSPWRERGGATASSAVRARAAVRAAGSATLRSIRSLDAELHKVGGLARKGSFGRRSKAKQPQTAAPAQ